jgi:hypothetical protein
MIQSLWKITFTVLVTGHARNNEVITLLDFGELCEEEPALELSQGNAVYEAMFQAFAANNPLGASTINLNWSRYREVLTNAAARSIGMYEQSTYPWGLNGKITIAVQGGLTIDYARSALLSMTPKYPLVSQYGSIHMDYTAALGKPTVVAGNTSLLYLLPNPYLFWFEEALPWTEEATWQTNNLRNT